MILGGQVESYKAEADPLSVGSVWHVALPHSARSRACLEVYRLAQSNAGTTSFTGPVCNTHHDQLHCAGDERAFWARHGILDPFKYAARLWELRAISTKALFDRQQSLIRPDAIMHLLDCEICAQ